MKLKVNREFLGRHLFVVVLMAALGCWFGYDGYVKYPSLSAEELYLSAHGGEKPRDSAEAEKFKRTAIPRQKEFMCLAFAAALAVGLHLLAVCRLKFEFDDDGFTWKGRKYGWKDIKAVDRSKWEKKGILKVTVEGGTITLDNWHHVGVAECAKKMI